MMLKLTELEHDAMLEVINIGIGYAADTLSRLVNDEVELLVPSFEFLTRQQAFEQAGELMNTSVCAVSQHVEGVFHSDAILIFSEQRAMQLVHLTMGDEMEKTMAITDFSEMQQEAMTEIANIILNACIGAISNLFNAEFNISLPVYQLTNYLNLLESADSATDIVMLLLINFKLSESAIQGHMLFKMDLPAFEDFKTQVNRLIENYPSLA